MSAQLLDGKIMSDEIKAQVATRVAALKEKGVVPTLAILRVGERPDDVSYETGAMKRCDKIVNAFFSTTEDDRATDFFHVHDTAKAVEFFARFIIALIDEWYCQLLATDGNFFRRFHIFFRQIRDFCRHRCRE